MVIDLSSKVKQLLVAEGHNAELIDALTTDYGARRVQSLYIASRHCERPDLAFAELTQLLIENSQEEQVYEPLRALNLSEDSQLYSILSCMPQTSLCAAVEDASASIHPRASLWNLAEYIQENPGVFGEQEDPRLDTIGLAPAQDYATKKIDRLMREDGLMDNETYSERGPRTLDFTDPASCLRYPEYLQFEE